MNAEEAKRKLVSVAKGEIGTREGANNWNKYAQEPMVTRLYGWNPQNQPWCCVFANWCYLTAFGYDLGSRLTYGGTAACGNSAHLFQQAGAWTHFPEVGDQAFFLVNGGINHTGIVTEVNGTVFITAEGNYSDKVSRVQHNIGDSNVAGFGRPNWGLIQNSVLSGEKETVSSEKKDSLNLASGKLELPELKYGSRGNAVKLMQAALILRGCSCGPSGVDGDFGPNTQAGLNRFKQDQGMEPDGKADRETWKKLLKTE